MDGNNFSKPALAIINALSIVVITGYLTTEYVIPYVKRRFFLSNTLKTKLQVRTIFSSGYDLIFLAGRKYSVE